MSRPNAAGGWLGSVAWLVEAVSIPNLRLQTGRTLLTLVGVSIGVSTIVATGAVTDSIFRSFDQMIDATLAGATLTVSNSGSGVPEALLEEIQAVEGVAHASPLVRGAVTLTSDNGDHRRDRLMIFGFDLLADDMVIGRVRSGDVEIRDRLTFVANADSIAVPEAWARAEGLEIGDSLAALTPEGARTLTVRGLVGTNELTSLYGDRVAFMDFAAAELLLGKEARFDRIDVWVSRTYSEQDVRSALQSLVAGRATVNDAQQTAGRGQQLLFALRVILMLAGFIAVVVGFFIVYHSVSASVQQRSRQVGLLHALGVSRLSIYAWMSVEAVVLSLVAIIGGITFGLALAGASLSVFGDVTNAWMHSPPATVSISLRTVGVASVLGTGTALGATWLALVGLFGRPTARLVREQVAMAERPSWWMFSVGASGLAFVACGLMLWLAPPTLPYGQLVTFILVANGLALAGFGVLGPMVAVILARVTVRLAESLRGATWLVASKNLSRNPTGFVIVVTAIVMAFGSALATVSLTASLKQTAIDWMDENFRSDLVVAAPLGVMQILTTPPLSGELVKQISTLPGVSEVQGVRAIGIDYRDHPAVLLAVDRAEEGFSLLDESWDRIAEEFWSGHGVLISDNLRRMRGVDRDVGLRILTPSGPRTFPVIGTFPDFVGGTQLGSFAISRDTYAAVWGDTQISLARVWARLGSDPIDVRVAIDSRLSSEFDIEVLLFSEARAQFIELIESAFRITNALVAVALAVSFVGVVNFLLTAIRSRRLELRTLRASGLSVSQIMASVAQEGLLVGVVGVSLGVIAGYVAARIIVLHSVPMVTGWLFRFVFPLPATLAIAAFALLLATLAALPPAFLSTRFAMQKGE